MKQTSQTITRVNSCNSWTTLFTCLLAFSIFNFSVCHAEEVTLNGNDPGNASSIDGYGSAIGWSDGTKKASAGKDYVVANDARLRTHDNASDYTFLGDKLIFRNGFVNLKHNNNATWTFPHLLVDANCYCELAAGLVNRNFGLAGSDWEVAEGGTLKFNLESDSNSPFTRMIIAKVTLAGPDSATILFSDTDKNKTGSKLEFPTGADLTGYTGALDFASKAVSGCTACIFGDQTAWPGNPTEMVEDSVKLAKVTLTFNGDITTGSNRGFDIGSSVQISVASGKTATINGPISAPNGFSKTGSGTLIIQGKVKSLTVAGARTVTQAELLSLDGSVAILPIDDQLIYAEEAVMPTPVVSNFLNNVVLSAAEMSNQFEIVYANNSAIGTAKVMLTGRTGGDYNGESVSRSFTIKRGLKPESYRASMEIAVGHDKVTTSLENFPVLVRLSKARQKNFAYFCCGKNGQDIRFALPDGTHLPHEIDTWNTSGESLVWVLLPVLKADTTFVMYWYPEAGATVPPNTPSDVWGDFAGVWHFNGADVASAADSSINGYTGAYEGGDATAVAGIVGSAFHKNSSGSFATGVTSKPVGINNITCFTVSGWLKTDAAACGYAGLIGKYSSSSTIGWKVCMNNSDVNMMIVGQINSSLSGRREPSFACSTVTEWSYFTAVFDTATARGYQNGVSIGTGTIWDVTNDQCELKLYADLIGCGDELRIRNGVTSAQWAAADYRNQTDDDFLLYGEVSSHPGLVIFLY